MPGKKPTPNIPNESRAKASPMKSKTARKTAVKSSAKKEESRPKLLSGGNPQITKGDGDGPVQAYITAMPGWKREVGTLLDVLIERTVPEVRKAVRWNSPFYGIEGQGWFLSYHCFTKYVKLSWLNGASLRPLPPIASKHPAVRYFHIYEHEKLDDDLLSNWLHQASQLPGDSCF